MPWSLAPLLELIPEPLRIVGIGGTGYLGKYFFDYFRTRPKEKRDDFTALTTAMQEELKRLTTRVEHSEAALIQAHEETQRCDENYHALTRQYEELLVKYKEVIEQSSELQEQVKDLQERIARHEQVGNQKES